MDKPMLVFKRFSIPSLLTRTTNDITQIQMLFTMGLQVVTRGPNQGYLGHWENPWQVRILDLGSSGGSHCQPSAMLI